MFTAFSDVEKFIKKENVKAIDPRYIDFKGRWRHVTLPASDNGYAMLKAGVGFDGSSVGFKKTHSSDMTLLIPDLTTGFIDLFLDVNCIPPGTVDTPWVERLLAEKDDPEAARQRLSDRHPLGRLGTADEIAHAALYLASPESAFVTGTNLVIDGGGRMHCEIVGVQHLR